MTFTDVLNALHAWLGRRVRADIESSNASLLAHFRGVLTKGHDLGMALNPRRPDAAVYFTFGDTAGGFLLDPRAFETARELPAGRCVRVQQSGGITFTIEVVD